MDSIKTIRFNMSPDGKGADVSLGRGMMGSVEYMTALELLELYGKVRQVIGDINRHVARNIGLE